MFILIFVWTLVRFDRFVVRVQWHRHRKLVPKSTRTPHANTSLIIYSVYFSTWKIFPRNQPNSVLTYAYPMGVNRKFSAEVRSAILCTRSKSKVKVHTHLTIAKKIQTKESTHQFLLRFLSLFRVPFRRLLFINLPSPLILHHNKLVKHIS